MLFRYKAVLFIFLFFFLAGLHGKTLYAERKLDIVHRVPSVEGGRLPDYEIELLDLALQATRHDFGSYSLSPTSGDVVTPHRGVQMLVDNIIPNYVRAHGYTESLGKEDALHFIKFPINLGIYGYRICFISEAIKNRISQITDIDELKKYTHGQGEGWSDVLVLRHNGFKVLDVVDFKGLYKMTAINRVDLFCRSANEIRPEYIQYRHISGLSVDESFALYYDHPRFFFTHKSNTDLI